MILNYFSKKKKKEKIQKTDIHFRSSYSVLLRMENVSGESFRENQNIISYSINFFPPENRAVYEIMCKNIAEPDRPRMTV